MCCYLKLGTATATLYPTLSNIFFFNNHLYCIPVQYIVVMLCNRDASRPTKKHKAAPATAATPVGKLAKHAVLLMLSDEDQAHRSMIEICAQTCDPAVHSECFQRAGSRHLTLLKITCTPADAARITFAAPHGIALPLRIGFKGLKKRAASPLLDPDDDAVHVLKRLQSTKNYFIPDGIQWDQSNRDFLHCSLYRVRSKPSGYKQAFTKVKGALAGLIGQFGTASGVRLVIKPEGGPYDYSRNDGVDGGLRVLL